MICLGIESTAHTFGVGIVSNKKVFSNVKRSYVTEKGGIIPMNAAMHHKKVKEEVLRDALVESKLSIDDVNFISFSQGPGIAPCLLQGMELAKNLAKQFKKPVYILADSWKAVSSIPIEQRDPKEVWDTEIKSIKIENPAFDVLPAKYITAIITEEGIHKL